MTGLRSFDKDCVRAWASHGTVTKLRVCLTSVKCKGLTENTGVT